MFDFQGNTESEAFLRILVLSAKKIQFLEFKCEKNVVWIHVCKYQRTLNGCNFSKIVFFLINKFLMLRILVGFIIPICASLSVANTNHSTSNTSSNQT